jgi:hypothetical protein
VFLPGNLLAVFDSSRSSGITWPFLERNRFQIGYIFKIHSAFPIQIQEKPNRGNTPFRRIPGRGHMIAIAISLTIFVISLIVCSLCRIPSRACRNVCDKSLIFENRAAARRFEDLLAKGDTESVHRILKALQQRGDIDIFESEKEIYVSGRHSVSIDHRRKITRGLLVSDYDPIEDFRNLSAMSRFNPDARVTNAMKDLYVSKHETVSTTDHEESKDDLFASDYEISELLENLAIRSGWIHAPQTPS